MRKICATAQEDKKAADSIGMLIRVLIAMCLCLGLLGAFMPVGRAGNGFYKINTYPGNPGIRVYPGANGISKSTTYKIRELPFTLDRSKLEKASRYAIYVIPESPQPVSERQLNEIIGEVAKLPPVFVNRLIAANSGIEILSGDSVADHPRWAPYKNYKTGHPADNRTLKEIRGLSGTRDRPAVVALGEQRLTLYERATILHEFGHTYDSVSGKLSKQADWIAIHKSVPWSDDYLLHSEAESFAESFAMYYLSNETRHSLPASVYHYFQKLE